MATVKVLKSDGEYKYVCEYACTCGEKVTYMDYEKPDKLQRCFECQQKPISKNE
jgi:hypothetical protein